MTFHNIRVAWRNLMKYKAQNVIAVLCLAVGLVCFSMSFIITQRAWEYWKRDNGDPRRVRVELYTQSDSLISACPDEIQRIADSHLPSIDFIDIKYEAVGLAMDIIDLSSKKHEVTTWIEWISPEHLNYLELRSALTGKRIPVLKPGDVIMTKGMQERTFGKDVNPVGFEIKRLTYQGDATVTDVVDTGDWMLNEDCIMIVTDMFKEWADKHARTLMRHFDVILAKGKTDKDLQRELQEVLPEYKVKAESRFSLLDKSGLFFTLFIGGSILLIGLFGFLKTQIQLFRLRQREMGLRKCMGAQKGQLFGLMMWEVAIVFFFVTLLALLLTSLLADYAVPILQTEIDNFTIDMPRTYATELWIGLATFLATAGIAALSVRKVITTPLSEVVGKSRRTSTRGRSLLTVLQMVVCQLLLFIVFSFGTGFLLVGPEEPANAEAFRSCLITDANEWKVGLFDAIPHMQHIAGSSVTASASFGTADGKGFDALITDEHLFGLLDIEVAPAYTGKMMIPVRDCRKTRDVHSADLLGYVDGTLLASLTYNGYKPMYVCICDSTCFQKEADIYVLSDSTFVRTEDDMTHRVLKYFEHRDMSVVSDRHHLIFRAKPGEYKAVMKELTSLHREWGKYTLAKAPVRNMYDVCCHDLRMSELLMLILNVMAGVALLCIVLTLFSSVSLDTRGRQKEVAIRKAHGASTRQIVWLFGKQYVWQLIVSSVISILICFVFLLATYGIMHYAPGHEPSRFHLLGALAGSSIPAVIVALVTLATVGYKIYKVSQLNPATIIKKE
ncbi:MAG: ABC transporter permease [Bacteroidaceae bacterium]|nr:ABC transporter permease [Bacteroidaceae bacterium]